jgi:hypothetical protein
MGKIKAFLMLSLIALGYSSALAALSTQDRAIIPSWQLLVNPGFESGTQGWTASGGTFTTTTTAANVGSGLVAGSWDSSAASQTLTSSAVTIPSGAYGRPAILSCNIQTPSGTATHKIQAWDGTNVLAEATIQSSTQYRASSVMFQMPGSGSIRARLISVASNEPSINVDDCAQQVLQSDVVVPVAQASFIGEGFIASTSGCTSTVTSTGTSLQDFPTTAACPGPTVVSNPGPGVLQTTDTDLPQFTFNNLPPGSYLAVMQGAVIKVAADGGNNLAISDGTTTSGQIAGPRIGTSIASTGPIMMAGNFNYTTTGNRTFKLQAFTETNGIRWINDSSAPNIGKLSIQLYRFPSTAETGVRPDVLPGSWSGYHENNCSWSRTNTAFGDPGADATCTFTEINNRNFGTVTSYLSGSDKLPGIVFTPARAGRYLVLVDLGVSGSVAPATQSWRMETSTGVLISEGSHVQSNGSGNYEVKYSLKGIVDAASTSPITIRIQCKASAGNCQYVPAGANGTIFWAVIALDQSFPAPLLVGSVTSNSSGMERVERLRVTNSGTPTISSQSGSWVSSLTDNGVGSVYVNLTASIFSGSPTCTCSAELPNRLCSIDVTASTSQVRVRTATVSPFADADMDFSLICMGPR